MFKTVIAGATALSLTFTAPATAQGFTDEQIGSFFIGLLGTAAILHMIENNGDAGQTKVEPVHVPPKASTPKRSPTVQLHTQPRPRSVEVRPRNNPRITNRAHMTLPARCLKTIDTRRGEVRMFTRRCLNRHYDFRMDFPQHCERSVRTRDGRRNGWAARCLRQAGYRIDRHR